MLYEAAGIARFRQRIDKPRDMDPLELVKLNLLVNRTSGRAEIVIGLLDGPVALEHPDLVRENIRPVGEAGRAACAQSDSSTSRYDPPCAAYCSSTARVWSIIGCGGQTSAPGYPGT